MHSAICIPTYNESENIGTIIDTIFSLNITDLSVLVIDDHSPDGTADIVRELQKQHVPRPLHLLERPGKLGLGSAYIDGFKHALAQDADVIFEMDADGSHDPHDILRLLAEIKGGADVAIGSRRVSGGRIIGWNMFRHIASAGAMLVARVILGLKTKDVTAGFRAYRRHVLESLELATITSNGYAFQEEMIWRCEKKKYAIIEIPVIFKDREHGISKLTSKDIIEFFKLIIKLMRSRYSKQ